MRFKFYLLVALLLSSPVQAWGQYDFDDFLNAVESGKSKTPPSSRIAQLPEDPITASSVESEGMLEVPSILTQRDVPEATILPTPESELAQSLSRQAPLTHAPQVETVPNQVDFRILFDQLAAGNFGLAATVSSECQTCNHDSSRKGTCAVMPYRQPILHAPSTLHGYFNASPCIIHLWDDYACEAAAECAKHQHKPCQVTGQVYDRGSAFGYGKTRCD